MSYAAFLFDLDGTLVDTADDLGYALNQVLSEQGRPQVGAEIYRPQASHGSLALLASGFGPDDWAKQDQNQLKQRFLDVYADNISRHSRCFDGVQELIRALDTQGVPWGIMTNKPGFLATPLVAGLASLRHCPALVCGDTLREAKPSPAPLLHTARLLGVEPNKCIYIGDAQRDIEAAHAAEMASALALWGYLDSDDDIASWNAQFEWLSPKEGIHYI